MIQIDIPMPEACDVCPFNYDFCCCNAFGNYDEWEKYSDDWNDHVCDRETRPEYCPLKEQPEIVRCKDCKFYQKPEYGFTKGDCTYGSVWYQTEEDDFCSKAKVKY